MLDTPKTITVVFTDVPTTIDEINNQIQDIPLSNVVVTMDVATPQKDVAVFVGKIQQTPITNLTVFVGPKFITNDQVDDIPTLDFSSLPEVEDIFATVLDIAPEMVIPILTEDNVADAITFEEMPIPSYPKFLGQAQVFYVEPVTIITDVEELKNMTFTKPSEVPKCDVVMDATDFSQGYKIYDLSRHKFISSIKC